MTRGLHGSVLSWTSDSQVHKVVLRSSGLGAQQHLVQKAGTTCTISKVPVLWAGQLYKMFISNGEEKVNGNKVFLTKE